MDIRDACLSLRGFDLLEFPLRMATRSAAGDPRVTNEEPRPVQLVQPRTPRPNGQSAHFPLKLQSIIYKSSAVQGLLLQICLTSA